MGFLDLFRPKWKHSDPNVRAEAIKDFSGDDDLPRLTQVARHDSDSRVRRIAIKKISDPDVLLDVAAHDPDDAIRRDAAEKAAELLLSAALSADSAGEAEAAIRRIKTRDGGKDERTLTDVVCRARLSEARHIAFERLSEKRSFVDVVRRASDPALRSAALDKIRDEEALADLLIGDLPKDLATRALSRVIARDLLQDIAARAKAKALRTAAREKLGLSVVPAEGGKATKGGGKSAPKASAPPAAAPVADRRSALCQRLEISAKSDDPADYGDVDDVIAAARAEWAAAPGEVPQALRKRFERAVARLIQRRDAIVKKSAVVEAAPLLREPVAKDADAPARSKPTKAPADGDPATGARAAAAMPDKPTTEPVAPAAPPELTEAEKAEQAERVALRARRELERKQREAEQAERMQREAERRAEEEKRRSEEQARNLARVDAECQKLERLVAAETLKPKAAEQALKAAQDVIVAANPLPREGGPAARKRYDAARAALVIRLNVLRDNEDWQRWANVPRLEELCLKIEALWVEVERRGDELDRDVVVEVLKTLQAEWKTVGPAPKEKSEALWQRFKEQGDRIFDKLRAGTEAERGANLAKKEELCTRVEALLATLQPAPAAAGAATDAGAKPDKIDWKAVGDSLKALQAEWKTVGPVPTREQADALWTRFKTAADQVHAQQKGHYAELDSERAENAKRKEALCQRAESLQYSNDWKGTGDAIKALQADWKAIGAAPKDQNEALWTRFRTACDKFFERRQAAFAEQDQERGENAKKKDALCQQAEALLAKDDLDQEAAEAEVKRLMAEWKRVGPAPKADNETLWKRFRAAADQVFQRGREYTMPVSEGGEKFSNKLPLAAALAKAAEVAESKAAAPAAPSASEVSPTWEEDSASAWADIDAAIKSGPHAANKSSDKN